MPRLLVTLDRTEAGRPLANFVCNMIDPNRRPRHTGWARLRETLGAAEIHLGTWAVLGD